MLLRFNLSYQCQKKDTVSAKVVLYVFVRRSKVAAITIGKDMGMRELQQGAWRMRGLAKGQGCEMLLPEEVALYMRTVLLKDPKALNLKNLKKTRCSDPKDLKDSKASDIMGEALRDIQSALLLKSLEQEVLQAQQLVRQDLSSAWKDDALAMLLDGTDGTDESDGNGKTKAVNCLLESVLTSIHSSEPKTLQDSLRDLANPFVNTPSICAAVDHAVARGIHMLGGILPKGEISKDSKDSKTKD